MVRWLGNAAVWMGIAVAGLVLLFGGFLAAGDRDRALPHYASPRPGCGCGSGAARWSAPPGVDCSWTERTARACYPPDLYPFYALGAVGAGLFLCGFAGGVARLVASGALRGYAGQLLAGAGALLLAVALAVAGFALLAIEFEIDFFGGGAPRPPDPFEYAGYGFLGLAALLAPLGGLLGLAGLGNAALGLHGLADGDRRGSSGGP